MIDKFCELNNITLERIGIDNKSKMPKDPFQYLFEQTEKKIIALYKSNNLAGSDVISFTKKHYTKLDQELRKSLNEVGSIWKSNENIYKFKKN